jgi:hypothetical protein
MKIRFSLRCALRLVALLGAASVAVRAQSPPASPSASDSGSAPQSHEQQKPSASSQTPSARSNHVVWVNTASHIYHQPGTRYYGKTKHGKYMLEADAIKAGYRDAAKN